MREEDCSAFESVIGCHPRVSEFGDLSGIEGAVVDGGCTMALVPDVSRRPVVQKGNAHNAIFEDVTPRVFNEAQLAI